MNLNRLNKRKNMQNQNYRNKLIDVLADKLTTAQILYSPIENLEKIKNKFGGLSERHLFALDENNNAASAKLDKIATLLNLHIEKVGKKQAIKDLQLALTLLNKNRKKSLCQSKNALKEDGIYGIKTHSCLFDVCKNYSYNVIKSYLIKGILNNIIFDTKNNPDKNTRKMIEDVCFSLKRRK